MRRALLVLSAAAALAVPSSASAAVTADRDAPDVAAAISAPAAAAATVATSWTPLAPLGNPAAISDGLLGGFPTNGSSFAVLSSGDATKADPAVEPGDGENGGAPDPASQRPSVYDLTTLRLDLRVPAGVNCAVLSFRFLTDEEPGDQFNDGFIAELDESDWTAPGGNLSGAEQLRLRRGRERHQRQLARLDRPHARRADRAAASGSRRPGSRPRRRSRRALHRSSSRSSTRRTTSSTPRSSSTTSTSRTARPGSASAARRTRSPRPSRSTTPANGAASFDDTPTFAGAAGEAAGDAATVGVEVRSGDTVVATSTATRAGAAWSVDSSYLGPGTYTVRATQADAAGNTGVSATHTFTVLAPPLDPPDPEDPPDPPDPKPGARQVRRGRRGVRHRPHQAQGREVPPAPRRRGDPGRQHRRRDQGPREHHLRGREGQDPVRRLLQGRVRHHPDAWLEADHAARAVRQAELRRRRSRRARRPRGRRSGGCGATARAASVPRAGTAPPPSRARSG